MQQVCIRWATTIVFLSSLYGCAQVAKLQPASGPDENLVATGSHQQNNPKSAPAKTAVKVEPLDAGTVIEIAINEPISSKINNAGDHFTALVVTPVMVGSKQVIPSGAKASGTIAVARSADRFKVGAELDVTLDSITVNTKTYPVQTAGIMNPTHSKKTVGEAAISGEVEPIPGIVVERGKWAHIDVSAGASAGTAGAAFTANRDITLLPGIKLSFRLTKSVGIRDDG